MKNKTYIFGVVCVLLISLGGIFKIQHWPLAGILLTLGLTLFTLAFMPTALLNSYKTETDKKLKKLYIIAYICILIDCAGMLFKIQHWPGAGIFLIVSIPLPFVLFLPAYLLQIRKNKQLNYNNMLLVLFFFGYFAAITALLAINISKDVLDDYANSANNYEQQAKLTNHQTSAIMESLSAKDSIKKEALLKIQMKSASLCELIDKIKIGIIKNVDDNNQQAIDAEGNVNLSKIYGLDDRNIYQREEFKAKAIELKKGLSEFRNLLVTSLNTKEIEVADYVNHLLNTPDNWQFNKFDGKYMIAIINALSAIKNDVALAELETVSAIDANSL
jgi:hypothetical protein